MHPITSSLLRLRLSKRLVHTRAARDYAAAVACLNSLQSNSNVLAHIRKHGGTDKEVAIRQMLEWFKKSGYSPDDFDPLNIIHVAGTKGKGSTCAFVSSILAQYSKDTKCSIPSKIGL